MASWKIGDFYRIRHNRANTGVLMSSSINRSEQVDRRRLALKETYLGLEPHDTWQVDMGKRGLVFRLYDPSALA